MRKLAFKRIDGQWKIVEVLSPETFISNGSLSEGLKRLSANDREDFEERAAIMEFEAGFERRDAEREALKLILAKRMLN